jgi:hypothetical protein
MAAHGGEILAVSGEFQWPPMGRFSWPPSLKQGSLTGDRVSR